MDKTAQPEFGFLDHLEELRGVFFRILICLVIFFPVCYYFSPHLLKILVTYVGPSGFKLSYFSPLEPFLVQMKIAFFGAIILSMPLILWQIWKFVAPGLYQHERMLAVRLIVSVMGFFLFGIFFGGFFILPLFVKFSLSFASDALEPVIGLEKFISVVIMLLFGFGLMFQFPIAIFLLIRSGLVKIETFRKQRPIIFIVILFLSAVLTPPDVISQILMGAPAYLLFELSMFFAGLKKVKARSDDSENYENDNSREISVDKKEPPPEKEDIPEVDDYSDYDRDPLPRKRRSLPGRSPASCIRKKRKRK
jgi:sec-independent protein translocase protein TatC